MTVVGSVALIATVRNEMPGIAAWLAALSHQTRRPDEIVIVDGGSTDGTWEYLQKWGENSGATVTQLAGANISAGRNEAISRTRSEIVVVTDAGTHAAPDWLQCLADAFHDPWVDVACGFFVPEMSSPWDRALAAVTLPDVREIQPERFLPSSRSVAFRRVWWDQGVRYPEWIDYCEDLIFDLALRRAGSRFLFVPGAVTRFKVRPSLVAYARQYYRYARGDGKGGLFARRHTLRYATYMGAGVILARRRRIELIGAVVLGVLYLWQPIVRLMRRDRECGRSAFGSVALLPSLPALRLVGDVAKMAGYPAGLAWRWRQFGARSIARSWRNISVTGEQWRPAAMTTENPPPTSLRDA